MWRNWTGDQRCAPAVEEHPASAGEVVAALERAAKARRRVRVAGAGHSFTDIALTDGHLLHLDRMDGVLDADPSSGLVRVEGGITIHALSRRLAELGLAMENLGDIDVQTISGALATGTHGTGGRLGNLATQVAEMEMVLADGSTLRCAADDPDTLRAARVGLGCLGVVTEVTLRCQPAFTLEGVDRPAPLEETLERFDELVEANDHFELFTFPHSDIALTRTNNRTDQPPAPPGRGRAYLDDVLFANRLFGLLSRTGRRVPGAIPAINRLVSRLAGSRRRVDRSDRIFTSPRLVRFTEMEYALPRAVGPEAVRRVLRLIDERRFRVNFPIEVRAVAADDAFLSPASGRVTCYVAVHMYRRMEWEPYFRAVEEVMDELGGRPHWGKRHFQTAETLRPRYPDWNRFAAVRARLDPEGRFSNEYTERVLGPVMATAPTAA